MVVDKEIYGAIGGVLGAILGALITLYGTIHKRKIEIMSADIKYLCNQLLAYYELERIYSEEISSLKMGEISSVRVKIMKRDEVGEIFGMERPGTTRSRIRGILNR